MEYGLLGSIATADAVTAIGAAGEVDARALWAAASRVCEHLVRARARSEVLVVCEDRCELAAVLLGCWQAGVAVALPPNHREGTLTELCRAERIAAVLARGPSSAWSGTPHIDLNSVLPPASTSTDAVTPQTRDAAPRSFDPATHLVTLYTSGTTGRHQPCEKTAEQLLGEATTLSALFQMTPERVVLATVPSHHIYGLLFGLLMPLVSRARFASAAPLHVEAIVAALERCKVTDLVSVPAHLQALSQLPRGALAAVRRVFSSAAPLDPATAEALRAVHGVEVVEVLGSTESGGIAWRNDAGPWRPLPGVSVSCALDGTIEVSSPFLAARDRPVFRGHDKIELLASGGFRHLGRDDGVVKVAGKRIALQEIEACARQLPGVSDAAAVVLGGSTLRGVEIGLVLVGPSGQNAALKQALLERFDAVVVPRRFRFVAALPREPNGKLSQARLAALFTEPAGREPGD